MIVAAFAGAEAALPAEALLLDAAARARPHGSRGRRRGLAKGVAAGDELRSPRRSCPCARTSRGYPWLRPPIRIAVGAFRVDVDQPICTAASGSSRFRSPDSVHQPTTFLRAPVDVFPPQTSARPPAKPKVLNPIDSGRRCLRIERSAQRSFRRIRLIGQSSRRALSRLRLIRQLLRAGSAAG